MADPKVRAQLEPIMAQLEALEAGAFMSLCELVVMFSERMSYGMLKWSTPRVIVHIKHPQKPKKEALRGCNEKGASDGG